MTTRVLIAGIGNIFQGDDAFGVAVAQRFTKIALPENIRVMDIGIRAIDLAFALIDDYDLTILVDATSRNGAPGTLYTIAIEPDDIPDASGEAALVNSHALNPVRVLALAKSLGAQFRRVLLVACEPQIIDRDDSGHIGLSPVVESAVDLAVETIRQLVLEFTGSELVIDHLKREEVRSYEHA